MKFLCEVCDREDDLTDEQAYAAGWDYPPFIGEWGVISPRTCPDCPITLTAWWALAVTGTAFAELCERHKRTVERVIGERLDGART